MSNDLQSIFKSITPDNIQSIPVIRDAMDVFISTLEEVSSVSIDVKNAFENTNIKEELIKIYLDDLYNVLQQIQFNQKIVEYIERLNNVYGSEYYKRELIYNITNYINDEHFLTIKSYKEKKGTTQAIKYVYDLISTFVLSIDTHHPFTLTELEPFNFKVEGSLPTVFYENIIRPLAHPLGFTYYYEQILDLVLEDFYAELNFVYTTYELEVRCLKTTGESHTFDFLYKPDGTKREVFHIDTILKGNNRIKRIFFKDGDDKYNNNATYLKQVTSNLGQTTVYYMQGVHLDPGQEYVIKKDYNGNVIYDANGEPERATADYVIRSFSDQCSIYHRYEFEFRTSLEEDLSWTDYKTVHDYWARLAAGNGSSLIGGVQCDNSIVTIGGFDISDMKLNQMDAGCNKTFDHDYNIVPDGAGSGRLEHYYAPSLSADLKTLEGKFELVNVNVGPALQVITKYGDDVKSTVSVTRTNPLLTFHKQNDGNTEYTAREHAYEDHWMNLTHCGELIEPVYSGTSSFIDYNGVDRGPVPGWLDTIGADNPDKLIGAGGESEIGYYIGVGYNQGTHAGNPNWINGDPNNPAIAHFKTCVDGDPVNLQYYTYDVSLFNTGASLTDKLGEFLDESSIVAGSLNEDFYGYYPTNDRLWDIGDAYNISDAHIHGKAFYEGYLPGTDRPVWDYQTTAVIDAAQGFDFTLKEFLVSTKENYNYRLYTNQDKYVFLIGNDNEIGSFNISFNPELERCDVYSEDVLAEVYRGDWNDYDASVFVDGSNYESRSETDIVSWVDVNYEPQEDEIDIEVQNADYEVYELDDVQSNNKVGLFDSFKDTNLEHTAQYIQMNGVNPEDEIYRSDWGTNQDFGAALDGVNNFDAITEFRAIDIFVDNFPETIEVHSTDTINASDCDAFEVHEQNHPGAPTIEVASGVYVRGYPAPITEVVLDTVSIDTDEDNVYEFISFDEPAVIGDFYIGDYIYINGKLIRTVVKSDIYRSSWIDIETGAETFEEFECGVYRDGVLLSDNNYARYVT